MVKSIVIDDDANRLLENILAKTDGASKTGLIIGTVSRFVFVSNANFLLYK